MGISLTEYVDSFESLPGSWVKRNPSTDVYNMIDRWEAVDPNTIFADQKAQFQTYGLRKKTAQLDFDDPVAQTITGVQEFDVSFYMGVFYAGETSQPSLLCDVYLDDGSSGKGTPSWYSTATLANNLFGISIDYDFASSVANHTVSIKYRRSGSVVVLYTFSPTAAEMPLATDTVQWFGFRIIFKDNSIKLYTDFGNTGVWVLKTTIANSAYIEANLTSVVIATQSSVTGGIADENALIDNFRLGTGDHIQYIDGNVQGLSLGTAEIVSVKAVHLGGAQGFARILIQDPGLVNWAVLKSNSNKLIVVKDTVYDNPLVIGEAKPIELLGDNTVVITVYHNSRKLLKTRCNYNPLLYSNLVRYVDDATIYDHINTLSPVVTGYAVTFEKASLTSVKLYPDSLAADHSPSSGSIVSLYQDDVLLDYGTNVTNLNLNQYFTFKVFLTDISVVTDIKFDLKYEILAENGGYKNGFPTWMIFKDDTAYDFNYLVQFPPTDGDEDEILINAHMGLSLLNDAITSLTIANVLALKAGANSSGYKEYELKLRFFTGDRGHLTHDHRYAFDIVSITIETNTEQALIVGQGVVDSASDNDNITLDNATPAWGLTGFPASEGFGDGDQYYVTRWLDDILATIFTNADTQFLISLNVTDIGNQVIFNRDLQYEQIFAILEEVKATLNCPWYLSASSNTIIQASVDNFLSTSIALTLADFVGNISYVVDSSNIRSSVTVLGKNDKGNSAITEEYTLYGGNEEEVITDQKLVNPTALNTKLASVVKKHTSAKISVTGILNYSNPAQSYAAIALYKTIALTLDDINGVEIVTHTSPELTIVKLELTNDKSTGFQDFVRIWLEELIS